VAKRHSVGSKIFKGTFWDGKKRLLAVDSSKKCGRMLLILISQCFRQVQVHVHVCIRNEYTTSLIMYLV
jgi:hypothetical protein